MKWLKGMGGAILAAGAMFLAAMAIASAKRQKDSADKWKNQAVTDAEADVTGNIVTAKAALSQAKLHDQKARDAKEKARKRLDNIGKRDETMAGVVSGWRSSRVRDTP